MQSVCWPAKKKTHLAKFPSLQNFSRIQGQGVGVESASAHDAYINVVEAALEKKF